MTKKKLVITAIVVIILAIISAIFGVEFTEKDVEQISNSAEIIVNTVEEIKENDVIVSNETENIVQDTIHATENGEDLSTTETIESTFEEEKFLEQDAITEQEDISYNGDIFSNGLSLLGSYQGLTYYSQADSRWANIMYSSTGNASQTIKSSGCGVTSAAIVVSSSKGTILPMTMAQLAVDNGYRTANSGTAWSYYPFIADFFDFNEYYTTSNFSTAISYLNKDKNNNGVSDDYYIVCSCGSGLFTSGGHYIVLVADNSGTITVYDPYLYADKFDTASRKQANVIVSGNSVFVTEYSFEKYANYKNFWIFSNDNGNENTNTTLNNKANMSVNYTRYVATKSSSLNVRSGSGTNYSKITSLKKGTKVTVTETNGSWSKIISPVSGWVNAQYLSSSIINNTTSYNTGKYKIIASLLKVRSGASTNYKAKTYKQLTSNARKQNKALGNYYANGYKKGVVCTVTEIKGNWGKTKSGWICLDYCTKM